MFVFFVLYSFTIVKVGLEISFSKPKYFKTPWVNLVLPEPSSPDNIIISPTFKFFAKSFAKLIVSSSLLEINLYIKIQFLS